MTEQPWRADEVRRRLCTERDVAERRLAGLRHQFDEITAASVDSNADDEHDPEGPTIAFERAQTLALTTRAERTLVEVGAAEARLAEGRYGTCEVCEQTISANRLEARPTARTCMQCATRGG